MTQKSYRQGIYNPKNIKKYTGKYPIVYRSSWELKLLRFLDINPVIIEWTSESIIIPYINPIDNKVHRYFIDFSAKLKDGKGNLLRYLIEVKPFRQTQQPAKSKNKKEKTYITEKLMYAQNISKWEAAKNWASHHGYKFIILTEKELNI